MLRIGRVDYLNTLPLFFKIGDGLIEEVRGTPASLVEKLRKGEIEGGIVSSVEFIINHGAYCIIPGISISSKRRICSVAIFSRKPIHEIENIYITEESLTSRIFTLYLLEYIYGLPVREIDDPSVADAVMLIGDRALKEFYDGRWEFVYDLAEEWYKLFKLPFIFALFVFRREIVKSKRREIQLFRREVVNSLKYFTEYIFENDVNLNGLPPEFIKNYLTECIDYSFTDEHLISLNKLKEIVSLYFPIKEKSSLYTSCL